MSRLVDILSDDVGRPVIDRTGFTERFNLVLKFAPHQDLGVAPSSGPTIFAAVAGLKAAKHVRASHSWRRATDAELIPSAAQIRQVSLRSPRFH
jgi:uncharacterized protein (TIGR03435 family)